MSLPRIRLSQPRATLNEACAGRAGPARLSDTDLTLPSVPFRSPCPVHHILSVSSDRSPLGRGRARRDRWQRPADIIQALGVSDGSSVADLGCGSGYFALKLSNVVGSSGRVLAVDIRMLPLVFLWFRGIHSTSGNLQVVHGEPNDPHLPDGALDALLIANTFHELTDAGSILDHAFRALRPGGRLVIVDRGGRPAKDGPREAEAGHHELSPTRVEAEVRKSGFEIVRRDDQFIDESGDAGLWWLISARKP